VAPFGGAGSRQPLCVVTYVYVASRRREEGLPCVL
jgi:hypothetical protein